MPKDWHSALPVVFLLVILSPLAIDIYLPSLPEMARALSVGDSAIQFTISLFMVCVGVGQLIAGPVSDRFGRRTSGLLGASLYIVGSLIGAGAANISTLYLARALQGVGAASCTVTAFAWVRDHFNAIESGRWITYMGGMIGAVPTLAPMLGGVLATRWGWPANFLFMACFALLVLAGVASRIHPETTSAATQSKAGTYNFKEHLVEILRCQQFLLYSMTGMLIMGGILSYVAHAPVVAMTMGGMDEFGFAMVFGGLGVVKLLISFMAPGVVSRVGRRRTILAGIVISLVGALWLLFISENNPLMFFIPAAVSFIGFNLAFGTASGLTLEPFKHCSGAAAAIDGCLRMAGGGLVAALTRQLGLGVFNTVAFTFGLLLIPLYFVINDTLARGRFRNTRAPLKPLDDFA